MPFRPAFWRGGIQPTPRASIEDAGAGCAWRVWAGRLSGWGISNLCQPHRKVILAFSGGFGNLPRQDCHPAGRCAVLVATAKVAGS